jgi:PAS domain S-box-containing protein
MSFSIPRQRPRSYKHNSRRGAFLSHNDKSDLSISTSIELLQSEESFLQILSAIGDLVLVKGPNSKLIWANQAFCDYYGMTAAQLRGILDAPFSEPDHTQQYVSDDAWVFDNKMVLSIPQEPVTRHDGAVRFFNTVKSPIFNAAGDVIMTVGISRDITDQLEAQKISEEQRARATYSSKMATLGEMAGGIAHELNTPLAAILLMAEMIENQNNSLASPDPEIAENAESISVATQRMSTIIKSLKGFSRDATNDERASFPVRELIESTLELCGPKFKNDEVSVQVVQDNLDFMVHGQIVQLSQTLLNLLHNAYDSIRGSANKWIKIETCLASASFEIRVTDSGQRIAKDIAAKIFQPFYTTKGIGEGTGLGLSISAAIVKNHGGELFYDSNKSNTTFVIRLPIPKSQKEAA